MNYLQALKSINPNFQEIIQQEVKSCNGETIGFHCYSIENHRTFAGGTHSSQETALRISVSESFERSLLNTIKNDQKLRRDFLIEQHPSSSGFAAGFEMHSTSFRALCEGVERWIWSKWIDEQYILEEVDEKMLEANYSLLAKDFRANFDQVKWYKKDLSLKISHKLFHLRCLIFLGINEEGIYPGSRVSSVNDNITEHPIIEAYRNFKNVQLFRKQAYDLHDIIQKRVLFFGQNKKIALNQIELCHKRNWPAPQIKLFKELQFFNQSIFLSRCLIDDYLEWSVGSYDRFVY